MNKNFKKKIKTIFAFTVIFLIMGIFFINFSNIASNKKYAIKFSIDLDEKIIFHLDRFDAILIESKIKNGREKDLSKIIKDYLNDNSIIKNDYLDFTQITLSEEVIFATSQSKDEIDSKMRQMIKEINKDISKKIINNLDLYIQMFIKSENVKSNYVLNELREIKKFKLLSEDNKESESIQEIINEFRGRDKNYQFQILSNLVTEYYNAVSGLDYIRLDDVVNQFYTEISFKNLQILIDLMETNFKNQNYLEVIRLQKNKEIISEIEFIKPGKVTKVIDKSPNIIFIIFLFALIGIFLGIIYSFGILRLMNKKRLKSLLYRE